MIALFCLFIPPLALVCLRERLLDNHKNIYASALTYAFSVLALNGILMFLLFYVFHSEDELLFKLNHHNGFACKYIVLSMALVFIEPFAEKFCREKVALQVKGFLKLPQFRHLKGLACIYALGLFLLNFIRIFDNNFWVDEAFTTNLVQHPLSEILQTTAADVHPPLYYLFVKTGYMIFGNQGWMFHLISLIPCAIILVFALTTVWKKFGKEAAVILITLAGLSNNAVIYNMEVRMYSWTALFVLLSFYELYNILTEGKNKNYILFALSSLAAAYTHYYGLVSVAFFYLSILILALRKKLELKKVLLTCLATIAAYLPWFFVLLNTFVSSIDTFWLKDSPTFGDTMNYLFSNQFGKKLWAVILLGIFIAFLYESGIVEIRKKEDGKFNVSVTFQKIRFSHILTWIIAGIASIVGTVGVGILVSKLLRPFFIVRYAYPVSIIAWLLLGITISRLKGKKLYTVLIVAYMLFVSIPAYQATYTIEKQANDTLQTTLATTKDLIVPGDAILANNRHMGGHIAPYYYPGVSSTTIDLSTFPELEKDITYWLIISGNVPEMQPVYREIAKQGFSYEQIVEAGNLGTHTVNIYQIKNRESSNQ